MKKTKTSIVLVALLCGFCLPMSNIYAAEDANQVETTEEKKDTTPPDTVWNVTVSKVENDPTSVNLEWDVAVDPSEVQGKPVESTGIKGYKIYYGKKSVQNGEVQSYDNEIKEDAVGNVNKYKISDLDPETKYYFSVTAVDKSGNSETEESEAYSIETSITTSANSQKVDTQSEDSFKVNSDATAEVSNQIKLNFTKSIVLPEKEPQKSFEIQYQSPEEAEGSEITVLKAETDPEDEEGKTVILTLPDNSLQDGVEYTITVGVGVQDIEGNVLESGITDTASLTYKESEAGTEPEVDPETDPASSEKEKGEAPTPEEKVEAPAEKDVKPAADEDPLVEEPEDTIPPVDKKEEVLAAAGDTKPPTETETPEIEPIEPKVTNKKPVDVKNLILKTKKTVEENMTKVGVILTWEPPSADDVVEQIIYMKKKNDLGFKKIANLKGTRSSYEAKDLKGGDYVFKIATKNADGESEGILKSIKVPIPETGMGIGIALAASGLASFAATRRKKK